MWAGLGALGDGVAARDDVLQRYAEPWRHYHALQHLGECLGALDATMHLVARPAEVEAALWFHDAVYALQRADNEKQSAQLAQGVLGDAGVASEVTSWVMDLILVTRHTAIPQAPDEQLLVDIDLSILGAPAARFAEKRRAILQSFLARPRLYSTAHFFIALEAGACQSGWGREWSSVHHIRRVRRAGWPPLKGVCSGVLSGARMCLCINGCFARESSGRRLSAHRRTHLQLATAPGFGV